MLIRNITYKRSWNILDYKAWFSASGLSDERVSHINLKYGKHHDVFQQNNINTCTALEQYTLEIILCLQQHNFKFLDLLTPYNFLVNMDHFTRIHQALTTFMFGQAINSNLWLILLIFNMLLMYLTEANYGVYWQKFIWHRGFSIVFLVLFTYADVNHWFIGSQISNKYLFSGFHQEFEGPKNK